MLLQASKVEISWQNSIFFLINKPPSFLKRLTIRKLLSFRLQRIFEIDDILWPRQWLMLYWECYGKKQKIRVKKMSVKNIQKIYFFWIIPLGRNLLEHQMTICIKFHNFFENYFGFLPILNSQSKLRCYKRNCVLCGFVLAYSLTRSLLSVHGCEPICYNVFGGSECSECSESLFWCAKMYKISQELSQGADYSRTYYIYMNFNEFLSSSE